MLGALIGAGASVLGGLFGSRKQTTTQTVDYGRMARAAEKAGFNPLTVLRNGGSAGFTSTVSHPGLSGVADAVAGIGQSFGAALDQHLDPIAQKRSQVESALLDYQLEQLQARPKAPMMFGDVPTRGSSGRVSQTVPPMVAGAKLKNGAAIPPMKFQPGQAPTVSTVGLEDRFGITPDPATGDAAQWEQRYGEPGDWVGGIYVGLADGVYNFGRKLDEWHNWSGSQPEYQWAETLAKQPRRVKRELPQTKHQADPGSWLDFAPKTTW